MSQRSKSLKEKKPKSDTVLAQNSLKNARADLKSAKVLYESECYPNAIYHLQQSLEKSWKSFGFYYGIITEGMARSNDIIGHKGSKVCIRTIVAFKKVVGYTRREVKALKNLRETDTTDQTAVVLNEDLIIQFDHGVDELITGLNNFTANEDKIRGMPYDEMKKIIDPLMQLDSSLNETVQKLDDPQIKAEICEKIRDGSYKFWRPLVAGSPHADKILRECLWEKLTDDVIVHLMKCTLRGVGVTGPLFPLAVITQVHEQTTRYGMDNHSPDEIYTATHPMIQLFPQIHAISETTLNNLERLYTIIPPDELIDDISEDKGEPAP